MMEYCCPRFTQTLESGDVVPNDAGGEGAWRVPALGGIDYCPFCGEDIRCFVGPAEAQPDMDTLEGLLLRIGETAYFRGIAVRGPKTLGLFGSTPLHIAATWGDCEAIRMLVAAGADLDALGEYDFTPLMEAVSQGHVEAVKLLVELGAKALPNEEGHSPSEFAAILKHREMEEFLRAEGF